MGQLSTIFSRACLSTAHTAKPSQAKSSQAKPNQAMYSRERDTRRDVPIIIEKCARGRPSLIKQPYKYGGNLSEAKRPHAVTQYTRSNRNIHQCYALFGATIMQRTTVASRQREIREREAESRERDREKKREREEAGRGTQHGNGH